MKKKMLFLMAMLASQATAVVCTVESKDAYCLWNKGTEDVSCHAINTDYGTADADAAKGIEACAKGECTCENLLESCKAFGYIYTGVTTTGDGADCSTGTWSGIGNNPDYTVMYCKWPTGCQPIRQDDEKADCIAYYFLYDDNACTELSEENVNDPNREALGCCLWDTESACNTIWSGTDGTIKAGNCRSGSNVFWEGECLAEGNRCPSTVPIFGELPSSSSVANSSSSTVTPNSSSSAKATSSSSGEGISSSSLPSFTYCVYPTFCLEGPFTICQGNGDGILSNSCPYSSSSVTPSSSSSNPGISSSSSGGLEISYRYCVYPENTFGCLEGPYFACQSGGVLSNTCPYNPTPIISLPNNVFSNSLSAMHNAINIQVTADAVIQVFDLKGNAISTINVSKGNSVVKLNNLANGLYIVKASNASWKKTVKLTVN